MEKKKDSRIEGILRILDWSERLISEPRVGFQFLNLANKLYNKLGYYEQEVGARIQQVIFKYLSA